MQRLTSPAGATVSYDRYGSGPPLVLVHGSFSDHETNWEFVKPFFEKQFSVHAIARRGRGETDATEGHSLEDESRDVVAVIQSIGEPVFLLGHSYGAQAALAAAARVPERVLKLVLYEAPWPRVVDKEALDQLEELARAGDWEGFAVTFFHDRLFVPLEELNELRATELWPPIIADAEASLGDLRALRRYGFEAERFRGLRIPVTLQIGTESRRDLYVTDATRRRPPQRPCRGAARPGARRDDHGAEDVCRGGIPLLDLVGARILCVPLNPLQPPRWRQEARVAALEEEP